MQNEREGDKIAMVLIVNAYSSEKDDNVLGCMLWTIQPRPLFQSRIPRRHGWLGKETKGNISLCLV